MRRAGHFHASLLSLAGHIFERMVNLANCLEAPLGPDDRAEQGAAESRD